MVFDFGFALIVVCALLTFAGLAMFVKKPAEA
jgi:hypothetical protein